MELNDLQTAVYSLVRKYVARQELVRDALSELRPDLLMLAEGSISVEELIELAKRQAHVPQAGRWGKENEWSYFTHGKGCRLTHTITQEPIEWDAADVQSFDRFWFVNYLKWRLDQDREDESISVLRSWLDGREEKLQGLIFDVLNQLQVMGVTVHSNPLNRNRFALAISM